MKYEEYIQSEEWHKQREKVIRRFKGRCATCGKKFIKNLHIHHRTYYYDYGTEQELNNLTLLCKDCHDLFHEFHEYCQETHFFIRIGTRKKTEKKTNIIETNYDRRKKIKKLQKEINQHQRI